MSNKQSSARQHIHVNGVVQGVGFRPFVYGAAQKLGLAGWVLNSSDGVDIQVEGPAEALEAFRAVLVDQAPPLSHIESITVEAVDSLHEEEFTIRRSVSRPGASLISPDVATCEDCLQEVLDPSDRRYGYPFTNCTNCGPRFTIIEGLPYDRPMTTMREFRMCPACQAEYDDPLDRRFHAQPNACPICGPTVWMSTGESDADQLYDGALASAGDAFRAAASLLRLGGTMAIKGLGGFHLACDATNDEAVRWLRRRKGRSAKPFAVMMTDLRMVRHYCSLNEKEEELLTSHAAPIVLLGRRPGTDLALSVAPRNHTVGVMLPYTPLHHILLREIERPLVMTSGNHTDEPLAQNNEDALRELGDIADAFLFHNRQIHARCDDSVWMVTESGDGMVRPVPVRRSRGYAPFPIKVHFGSVLSVLGTGAQMKNVFSVLQRDQVFMSQHIGELDNLETLDHYRAAIDHLSRIFETKVQVLAHDMHPDYLSTKDAKQRAAANEGMRLEPVQHHHAHIASCMADNGIDGPVIGVALDGTGYGSDGMIWGGEYLVADYRAFERVGHLEYLPLAGGEAAIRRPYRTAIGYLVKLLGSVPDLPAFEAVPVEERRIIGQQVRKGLNAPLTSSCGRLFDAVSAMIGVRGIISYEAQAAIELEMQATEANGVPAQAWLEDPYPIEFGQAGGAQVLQIRPLLEGVLGDLAVGETPATISSRFHATLASVTERMCKMLRQSRGLNRVALSGGCFQNRLLLGLTSVALAGAGFEIFTHQRVPPNDGGVALGQVAVAAHRLPS